ncbi:MAG TPA: VTT domain-containing protein [Candidatus Saccharimonadales bacterium]|nr:VTT domain-containing protein [Candidatus Saccharimonadales bacterium]
MTFGIDLIGLVKGFGLILVYAMIFIESGLFFGFFFPGDSLLFTAGLLASQHVFSVWGLVIGSTIAAIIGVNVGYHFGKVFGPRIFNREESIFFHKKNIQRAEDFYKKYGAFTIILARFTPFVRTFAPIFAGIGHMNYRVFMIYNIIGALLWVFGVSFAGYFLGQIVPNIDKYILPIIALIIVLSIIPALVKIWSEYLKSRSN